MDKSMNCENNIPTILNLDKPPINNNIIKSSPINIVSNTLNIKPVEKKIKTKKSKRCGHPDCNKKLKLTDLTCDCSLRFCTEHRLPHVHNCPMIEQKQKRFKESLLKSKCVHSKVQQI